MVPPAQLSLWYINMSSVLFSWQCTDEYKIGYVIYCYQEDNITNMWFHNVTTLNSCVYLEEQCLRSNHVFICKVTSFNEFGFGPSSHAVHTIPQYEGMLLDYMVCYLISYINPEMNPAPSITILSISMNSVTMAIESHDVPDGYVAMETFGYEVTCWSSSVTRNAAAWGGVVEVTIDKLLPGQNYSCSVIVINTSGNSKSDTFTITTLASG